MKKMILVVDDTLISRLLPGFMLKASYPEVTVFDCASGEDALQFIASQQITHVLLDISMPGLGGIQVARAIKEKSHSSRIKVIAYTADVEMLDKAYYKSLGFSDVLLKPIGRMDLIKVFDL